MYYRANEKFCMHFGDFIEVWKISDFVIRYFNVFNEFLIPDKALRVASLIVAVNLKKWIWVSKLVTK